MKIPLSSEKKLNNNNKKTVNTANLTEPTQLLTLVFSHGFPEHIIPQVTTKTHRDVSFSYYGPQLWKRLPESLGAADTVDVF